MQQLSFYFTHLFLFLCSFTSLFAQQDSIKTDHSYLRMKTENDFWITHGKSDRYFSNGARLEYQLPQGWFRTSRMKKIFMTLPNKKYQKTKISILSEMRMYTPENLAATMPVAGDRPYAGVFTLGLGGVSNDFLEGQRITTEYQIGIIGPAARQKTTQIEFHKFIIRKNLRPDAIIPNGWDYQIQNTPAINVRTEYEKNIFSPVKNIETIGGFEVNFGTVTNYIGLNSQVRLGLFNDYFFNNSGLKMNDKVVNGAGVPQRSTFYASNINRNWQCYFFAKTSVRFALYNSLLQGINLSVKENPYVLSSDELKRFYFNAEFGYAVAYKRLSFIYTQLFRSPEFITAKPSTWGALTLVVGMGK